MLCQQLVLLLQEGQIFRESFHSFTKFVTFGEGVFELVKSIIVLELVEDTRKDSNCENYNEDTQNDQSFLSTEKGRYTKEVSWNKEEEPTTKKTVR